MKTSRYIQLPQAIGFIEAAGKAYCHDIPWNTHIVIHLQLSGVRSIDAAKHVQQSIHKLGKYHKRHGMPFSYGWVLENAGPKGTHVHILLHRPNKLPMHSMRYRYDVLKIFKLPNKKGVLKVEKFWSHQSYETNLYEMLSYVLKGLRKGTEDRLEQRTGFRIKETKDQGLIYSKRISWSR